MVVEEFVLSSLRASHLIKPFLTPGGWQELKCVGILEFLVVSFLLATFLVSQRGVRGGLLFPNIVRTFMLYFKLEMLQ